MLRRLPLQGEKLPDAVDEKTVERIPIPARQGTETEKGTGIVKVDNMDPAIAVETLVTLSESQMTNDGLLRLLARWGLQITGAEEVIVGLTSEGSSPLSARCRGDLILVTELQSPQEQNSEALGRWEIAYGDMVHAYFRLAKRRQALLDPRTETHLRKLMGAFGFFFHQRFLMDQANDQAIRDELTGCFNRRYLRQAMERWIPEARAERFPISLFLLDVDHFKMFNDRFGHAVGDQVLRMLGGLMRRIFRAQDVVCRYGGEEFAVLLCDHRSERSGEHPQEVIRYAERLRRGAERLRLDGALTDAETSQRGASDSVLSHITISGGIATFPWDAGSADELLQKADEALYRAKRDGRNRIYLAERPRISRVA